MIKLKCRYKQCKHGGEVDKGIAVKEGNAYYHKKCWAEKNNKTQIREIYYKYYKSQEPVSQVNTGISKLCEKVDSEFVLYALCQWIRQKKELKSIYGLSYVIANKDLESAYKKLKATEKVKEFKGEVEVVETETIQYHIENKSKSWKETLFGK